MGEVASGIGSVVSTGASLLFGTGNESAEERKQREATDPVLIAAREAKLKIAKDLQDQQNKQKIETQATQAQSEIMNQRKKRLGAAKEAYFTPTGTVMSNTSNQKTILGA
jgi:hypothetical protein